MEGTRSVRTLVIRVLVHPQYWRRFLLVVRIADYSGMPFDLPDESRALRGLIDKSSAIEPASETAVIALTLGVLLD